MAVDSVLSGGGSLAARLALNRTAPMRKKRQDIPEYKPQVGDVVNFQPTTDGGNQTIPTIPVATPAKPVISRTVPEPKKSVYTPPSYSLIDGMDTSGLQSFVDSMSLKQMKGEQLTDDEVLSIMQAQRRLTNPQQTMVDPYADMIAQQEQVKNQAYKRAQQQANEIYSADERAIESTYDRQRAEAIQTGERAADAVQQSLSFSGFGRSTYAAQQQQLVQQQVSRAIETAGAIRDAELARARAERNNVPQEVLNSYDEAINQLRAKSQEFQVGMVQAMNEYNLMNTQNFNEKVNNILQLAMQFKDTQTPLTEDEMNIANSYASLAIDAEGNINEGLLKSIPPKMLGAVLIKAAELKGAIEPTTTKEYGFSNMGSGVVAIQDPTTGEVRFEVAPTQPSTGGGGESGMRTDRHRNPTAFTTDIAKQAGLVEGVDYVEGDPFPNNPNVKTAMLLGDPIDTTIKVIDKVGFYTKGGQQRWQHTAMSKEQWNAMSKEQKTQVVLSMYQKEGGNGQLMQQGSGDGGFVPQTAEQEELMNAIQSSSGKKTLPSGTVQLLSDGKQLPKMLDEVYQFVDDNKSLFGPLKGRFNALNEFNPRAQLVEAKLKTATQVIGKFLEGGVLRKEDEVKYAKMLPSLKDSPKTAYGKIEILKQMLSDKYQDYIRSYAGSYDVTSFPANPFMKKQEAPVEKNVKRTGVTKDGRKVVEYEDGTMVYQ